MSKEASLILLLADSRQGLIDHATNPDPAYLKREAANAHFLMGRAMDALQAARSLLEGWNTFTENGAGWGNYEDAYQCLAKGMSGYWAALEAAMRVENASDSDRSPQGGDSATGSVHEGAGPSGHRHD